MFIEEILKKNGFRSNVNYIFFNKGKFSTSIGLGYSYQNIDALVSDNIILRDPCDVHSLEIPLKLYYQLTDKLEINGSIILAINLNDQIRGKYAKQFRIGLNYRW